MHIVVFKYASSILPWKPSNGFFVILDNILTFQFKTIMEKTQNTSFYQSILKNETKHIEVVNIRHIGERVSIVLQALNERGMVADFAQCIDAVSEIVEKYCNKVENALSSASKDTEPEI